MSNNKYKILVIEDEANIQNIIETILESNEYPKEVSVSLSKIDHVTVHPERDVEVLMPNALDPSDLERTVTLYADPVEAPVFAGDVLGTIELSYDGHVYAKDKLLALNDVEASKMLVFWRDVQLFFSRTAVKVTLIVLAVLVVLLILWKLIFGRRRYRYGRRAGVSRSRNYRGRRR